MKTLLRTALSIIMATLASAQAQTYTVTQISGTGAGTMVDAIYQANLGAYSHIEIQEGLGPIFLPAQQIIYTNVSIEGNFNTIDMNNVDRAFTIVGGNVSISNLTFTGGNATGGSGGARAGGGAGLGGAIFIANGPAIQSNLVLASNVTLSNVDFINNKAVGGAGGSGFSDLFAGGGGMGGNGATGGQSNLVGDTQGGGGGGGFGNGANGGDGADGGGNGSDGAFIIPNVTIYPAGQGGYDGGTGGSNGGGGGGGSEGFSAIGGGGGGGVNAPNTTHGTGGIGGFGGGGGGSSAVDAESGTGGIGGFGGGGGSGMTNAGGAGGFGGGGAANNMYFPNNGGFGGGQGSNSTPNGVGGGGAGMGGAIFVMQGANLTFLGDDAGGYDFFDNSVTGGAAGGSGTDAAAGSAIGTNIFLGGYVAFDVQVSRIIGGLGGAGDLSDPNVSAHANDPNAQGGLIKQGPGTLVLTGANYYSGMTVINSGQVVATTSASLGIGAVQINGGQLLVQSGSSIPNAVILSGGSYAASVSGEFTGLLTAQSDLAGGRDTDFTLLSGSVTEALTLEVAFAATSGASNDGARQSDVVDFSNLANDLPGVLYALQLSVSSVTASSFLGWLDENNQWVNAVDGNTGNNASAAQQGYQGSFADFQLEFQNDLSLYIGAYGVDTATDSVWAVVNHNSDFSVIPEPGTLGLFAMGAGLAALGWRRRVLRKGR